LRNTVVKSSAALLRTATPIDAVTSMVIPSALRALMWMLACG
jgi:hypothetical protein